MLSQSDYSSGPAEEDHQGLSIRTAKREPATQLSANGSD